MILKTSTDQRVGTSNDGNNGLVDAVTATGRNHVVGRHFFLGVAPVSSFSPEVWTFTIFLGIISNTNVTGLHIWCLVCLVSHKLHNLNSD